MPEVPRRLAALFGVAAVGVLLVVGIAVGDLLGTAVAVGYAALVLAALAVVVARARRAAAPAVPTRHCTCCDGDHSAPVKVV